jgi:hypothetical protein
MLPPEFYEQIQRIKDHQLENPPPPKTVGERATTVLVIALFIALVSVFALGFYYQEIRPWIDYILGWFN